MADSMSAMSFSPGIFEVDLISPRNQTYTPQTLLPIVFALQNPPLASTLALSITWELWEGNNRTSPGSVTDGGLEPGLSGFNSSEPFFVTRYIDTTPYPDGFWTFAWSVLVWNCSQGYDQDGEQGISTNSATVFTISQSGQAPNLVAATSSDMCSTTDAYAFNVTSDGDTCGFLGPTPTTNPCAVTINASAASSIMAEGTAMACNPLGISQYPNVTCPPFSVPSSKNAGQSRMAAASTWLMLLTMGTALIHCGWQ